MIGPISHTISHVVEAIQCRVYPAQRAFEALGLSTHLYDRRLVLEWAKEEETVEELRKRTAQHFLGQG